MKRLVLTAIAVFIVPISVVVAGIAAGGGLVSVGHTSAPNRGHALHPNSAAGPNAAIDQLSEDFAALAGDPQVSSAQWVASNRGAAASELMGATIYGASTQRPVYAIEMTGSFVLSWVHVPSGKHPPAGTTLQIIVDQSTWQVLDLGVQNSVGDLGSLGPISNDNLSGLSPMTESSWQNRFGYLTHRTQSH
jgi:hypothetical protein